MPLTHEARALLDHAIEQLHKGEIDIDEFRERLASNGFPTSEINFILEWEGFDQ